MSRTNNFNGITEAERAHREEVLASMFAKGTMHDTCPTGHTRTPENTRLYLRSGCTDRYNVRCMDCVAEKAPDAAPRLRTVAVPRPAKGYAAGEWASVALCQDLPSALVLNTKLEAEDEAFMARTCAACPVAQQCAEWAQDQPYFEGVAGGVIHAPGSRRPLRELEVSAA